MSDIQLFTVTEIPKATRSRRESVSKYPYDLLQVFNAEQPVENSGFFVPATEDNPKPWKSIQSSLTLANQKYSEPTGEFRTNKRGKQVPETRQVRHFIARRVEQPTVGVLVIRVA